MAAVPVTLVGVMTAEGGSTFNCTFNGIASLSGLSVGGGPIIPPSDAHPEHPIHYPPGIWGPGDPRPQPPIVLPPYEPGGPPVGIWPSPGHPAHPIVLPEPPPVSEGGDKPPPAGQGGWGYYDGRWGYFPGPGEAQPKG